MITDIGILLHSNKGNKHLTDLETRYHVIQVVGLLTPVDVQSVLGIVALVRVLVADEDEGAFRAGCPRQSFPDLCDVTSRGNLEIGICLFGMSVAL